MNAVIWEGINKFRYTEEAPEPVCGEDMVIVKVMSAGFCSTDAHIIAGRFNNGEPPHILGHEICGVITEKGRRVTSCETGDRVVVETAVSCGKCVYCLTANKHLCADGHEIGFPPYQGGYAQYVAAPASCIHKIPDQISFDEGGIMEACVCPFGAICRIGMRLNETVLIQGVGVAGLSYIQAVRCFSPAKIIVAARSDYNCDLAKKFGADVAVNIRSEDLAGRVMAETGGVGVTLSIDAAGAPSTIRSAVELTAPGGRCLLYGLPAEDAKIDFPAKQIIMRQITVTGVTNNELAWEPLIEMTAAGKFNIKDMVTHHFALDQFGQALDLVNQRPQGLIKAVIHPWEGAAK